MVRPIRLTVKVWRSSGRYMLKLPSELEAEIKNYRHVDIILLLPDEDEKKALETLIQHHRERVRRELAGEYESAVEEAPSN